MASRADEGRGKTAISLGELSSKLSRGFPNEATLTDKIGISIAQHIGYGRQAGEVKHLSTPRRRKRYRYP